MMRPYRTSSISWRLNKGMTLIEVTFGLALLGSLMVGLLLARESLSRQGMRAARRIAAVEACDRLLSQWQLDTKGIPRRGTGPVGSDGKLQWTTRVRGVELVEHLTLEVVRLEVIDTGTKVPQTLASVEVLLPPLPPENK